MHFELLKVSTYQRVSYGVGYPTRDLVRRNSLGTGDQETCDEHDLTQ